MAKRKFLTPHARQKRIQLALDNKGWTWYHLSKVMGRSLNSVQKSFFGCNEASHNPNLETLKLVATALGLTIGFLTEDVKRPRNCRHCGRKL